MTDLINQIEYVKTAAAKVGRHSRLRIKKEIELQRLMLKQLQFEVKEMRKMRTMRRRRAA